MLLSYGTIKTRVKFGGEESIFFQCSFGVLPTTPRSHKYMIGALTSQQISNSEAPLKGLNHAELLGVVTL